MKKGKNWGVLKLLNSSVHIYLCYRGFCQCFVTTLARLRSQSEIKMMTFKISGHMLTRWLLVLWIFYVCIMKELIECRKSALSASVWKSKKLYESFEETQSPPYWLSVHKKCQSCLLRDHISHLSAVRDQLCVNVLKLVSCWLSISESTENYCATIL